MKKNFIKTFIINAEKYFEQVFENKIFKYSLVYIIVFFIFYLISPSINGFILKYGTVKEELLFQFPNLFILSVFLIILLYFFYKKTIKRYQLSSFQTHFLITSFLGYLLFRCTNIKEGWNFISYNSTNFYYIDFLGLILLSSIIQWIVFLVMNLFKSDSKTDNNPYESDDPVESCSFDKLEYHIKAKKIIEDLDKSNFNKSFTIGLIGSWGSGKSSFISLMEEELKLNPLKATIHLKFLPYLNHSENEIISEFFNQLSSELSKYSGKLSNHLLSYSDKLIKFYKDRNVIDFFKPNTRSFIGNSTYELYNSINLTLKELDKKFIIFIDDLDRLSNNEILQVLKLVRNTANFKNFIFIIALDKEYVLGSLLNKKDIFDHLFVDKFFQLEIYLPEINKTLLKEDFIILLKSKLPNKEIFTNEVEKAIVRNDNLFDDYILNYRDLKRLVNQIVYDYAILSDELNTNDFLNFIYLKMTFPYAIKFLKTNLDEILPYNSTSNLRELEVVKENDNQSDSKRSIFRRFNSYSGFQPNFKKYELTSIIKANRKKIVRKYLTIEQNQLLAKTIIALFGEQNTAETHTSIKFGQNLRKLLEQNIPPNDLSYYEFESTFNFENDFEILKAKIKDGHINNILNRLVYYNASKIEEAKNTIILLLHIFSNSQDYNTFDSTVWNVLANFYKRNLKMDYLHNTGTKQELWEHIKSEFIDKETYKEEAKLKLLAYINDSKHELTYEDWGTDIKYLESTSLKLYNKLLTRLSGKLWDIKDYYFYGAYHDVNKYHLRESINPLFINFWKENNITLLCAQMVDNDAWTTKMLKTSDFAKTVFNSKSNYKDFIFNNLPETLTEELKEYKEFIYLESLTNFKSYILYKFVEFDLVNYKLRKIINDNKIKKDDYDNVSEIVVEANSENLGNISQSNLNNIDGIINSRKFINNNNKHYIFINLKTNQLDQSIFDLLEHYQNLLKEKKIDSKISNDFKELNSKEGNIKIISIQPRPD